MTYIRGLAANGSAASSQTKLDIAYYNLPLTDIIHLRLKAPQLVVKDFTLRWRHNDHAGVSNHQPHGCLLTRSFRRKSKKTSKLRVTGLCAGNSPGTGVFPAQMASYAENVSIWWRHHEQPIESRDRKFMQTKTRILTCFFISNADPWFIFL